MCKTIIKQLLYVVVLMDYTPAAPPFLLTLQHVAVMVAAYTISAFQNNHSPSPGAMQMVAPMATICTSHSNGLVPVSWLCPPGMHMVPLYKRASSPSPWLTFWLNVTQVTSRSRTRHLTQTLTRLSVYSPFTH